MTIKEKDDDLYILRGIENGIPVEIKKDYSGKPNSLHGVGYMIGYGKYNIKFSELHLFELICPDGSLIKSTVLSEIVEMAKSIENMI